MNSFRIPCGLTLFLFGMSSMNSRAIVFAGEPPAGEDQATYMVITTWNSDCSGSTRDSWNNMVDRWYDDITDGADAWNRSSARVNGNIKNEDFADPSLVGWGDDYLEENLDGGDAVMVGLHGSEQGGTLAWSGKVRVGGDGDDDDGDCNAEQDDAEAGDFTEIDLDSDVEFLHLSSCHSLCWDNRLDWGSSFNSIHQLDGFHGLMWIGASLIDEYGDFAEDAFDIPIAEAWLDNLFFNEAFSYWVDADDDDVQDPGEVDIVDQCPMAMGGGDGCDDLWDRMDNERYDNVYVTDPDPTTCRGRIYIRACDPADDPPLPN